MWTPQTYTIVYNANGGYWQNNSATTWSNTATYGSSYSMQSNWYLRNGYTFKGWTTKSDGTDDGYGWTSWNGTWTYLNGQYGISNNTLTLYAGWNINTVCVQFDMNGGYLKSNHGTGISTSGSLITLNGSTCVKTYSDGETGIDLPNNNNDNYINLARSGYKSYTGQEWCTSASGGTCYNQTNANISANNLCNLAAGNCTVTLYAHWKKN